MATTRTRKNAGVATPYSHHSLNRSGGDATVPGGKEVVERMLSARRLTSLLSRSSTTTKAEVNGFGNRQKETKTLLTRRWREPDSNHRSRSCERSLGCGDERYRTDKLDGVIKHRSSRETRMVGRGATLDGRLFLSGTDRRYGAGGEEWQLRRWIFSMECRDAPAE